jgi:hypothetical protein
MTEDERGELEATLGHRLDRPEQVSLRSAAGSHGPR